MSTGRRIRRLSALAVLPSVTRSGNPRPRSRTGTSERRRPELATGAQFPTSGGRERTRAADSRNRGRRRRGAFGNGCDSWEGFDRGVQRLAGGDRHSGRTAAAPLASSRSAWQSDLSIPRREHVVSVSSVGTRSARTARGTAVEPRPPPELRRAPRPGASDPLLFEADAGRPRRRRRPGRRLGKRGRDFLDLLRAGAAAGADARGGDRAAARARSAAAGATGSAAVGRARLIEASGCEPAATEALSVERRVSSEGRAGRARSGGPAWLPFVSEYRTLCIAPWDESRRVLEGIGALRLSA